MGLRAQYYVSPYQGRKKNLFLISKLSDSLILIASEIEKGVDRDFLRRSLSQSSAKVWISERDINGKKIIRAGDLASDDQSIQNDWLDVAKDVKKGIHGSDDYHVSITMLIANLERHYKTAVVLAHAWALLALLAFSSPAHAESLSSSDTWTFAVKPYLWLPNVNGTLRYEIPPGSGGGPTVDLGNYILENLSIALMISGEARKGDWAIVTDLVYLDVNSQNSKVKSVDFAFGPGGRIPVAVGADLGTKSSLSGELWELVGAYTMAHNDKSAIDVLGGFRYLSIQASTDWQLAADVTGPGPGQSFGRSGSISQGANLWDLIIGVRGLVGLGSGTWAIPYYLDVGTGSSALTWQVMAGIEYRFRWGDVQLSYRYLYYNMKDDELLKGVSFSGPGLGVNFRF